MQVKIVNKSGYDLPGYAYLGDSGMDVRAASITEPYVMKPFERVLFRTGLFVDIPEKGYEIQVRSRSGETLKKGLVVLNSPGTVDYSYIGEIGVILCNMNPTPTVVEPGERIAQIVLAKVEKIVWKEIPKIDNQEKENIRSNKGYNSSGNK